MDFRYDELEILVVCPGWDGQPTIGIRAQEKGCLLIWLLEIYKGRVSVCLVYNYMPRT